MRWALDDAATVLHRIRSEFREMPGLRITIAQASRLFSSEPGRCERVLGHLVELGELSTDGRLFARGCRSTVRVADSC